ncbi:MAG: phosphate signaling complex protein PhoU [bacterium]|jgi:phosphate transport system protein
MTNPRIAFEKELRELDDSLLTMGKEAETMLENALTALAQQDIKLADKVIEHDDIVDDMRFAVEKKCIELIATQHPAAKDLRRIFAAIAIASDVERVGDYSVDIAKIVKRLPHQPFFKPLIDIPKMERAVAKMLREGLEGFVSRDLDLIEKMLNSDDEVDRLYEMLHDELCDFMKRDPSTIDQAVQLLLVSRYLERIADHITNMGERVFYVETGKIIEV